MTNLRVTNARRLGCSVFVAAASLAASLAALSVATPAHAYWRGPVVFGWPFAVVVPPPPIYVQPPVVYAAPPVVAVAPAPAIRVAATCYQGPYVCGLPALRPLGSACACPGIASPYYGTVH